MNNPQFPPQIAYKGPVGSLSPSELIQVNRARPQTRLEQQFALTTLNTLLTESGCGRVTGEQETVWLKLWAYVAERGQPPRNRLEATGVSLAVAREFVLLSAVPPSFLRTMETAAERQFVEQLLPVLRKSPGFQNAINGPTPEQFQGALHAFLSFAYDPVVCKEHWQAIGKLNHATTSSNLPAFIGALHHFGNAHLQLSGEQPPMLAQLVEAMLSSSLSGLISTIPTSPPASWWLGTQATLGEVNRYLGRFILGSSHPLGKAGA